MIGISSYTHCLVVALNNFLNTCCSQLVVCWHNVHMFGRDVHSDWDVIMLPPNSALTNTIDEYAADQEIPCDGIPNHCHHKTLPLNYLMSQLSPRYITTNLHFNVVLPDCLTSRLHLFCGWYHIVNSGTVLIFPPIFLLIGPDVQVFWSSFHSTWELFSSWGTMLKAKMGYMEFVVYKVALGQIFSLRLIIPPMLHTHLSPELVH